jgi:hypothetical protein
MHLKMQGFFHVKKAQFEKSGELPKFGFASSQKSLLEASYIVFTQMPNKRSLTLLERLW